MRELKFAILGLVNRNPITGYDITKCFGENLSKFWEAKHSQIYPELKRLTDEGLVEFRVEIQGERLEKKLYTITDKGRSQLLNWLQANEELEPIPKDAFRLRLYFAECLKKSELSVLFTWQKEKRHQRLDTLECTLRKYGLDPPKMGTDEFSEYMLILGGILRERAYIQWIELCEDLTECSLRQEDLSERLAALID